MACCEGKENVMKDVTPPEIQKLRKQQATIASNKLSSGATASPYGGPLSAQADPLTLMASNMMTQLAGYNPYQSPMQGGGQGGGQGSGGGPASWAGRYSTGSSGGFPPGSIGGQSGSKMGDWQYPPAVTPDNYGGVATGLSSKLGPWQYPASGYGGVAKNRGTFQLPQLPPRGQ